jgi:hypothetical protein
MKVEEMSSEELGLVLNKCYGGLMREQNNINTINDELKRRQLPAEDEDKKEEVEKED